MKDEPAVRSQSYMRGWVHGATFRPRDSAFTQSAEPIIQEEYEMGWYDGQQARRAASKAVSDRTGNQPIILRAQSHA